MAGRSRAVRCIVSGRVQGVFFRASTRDRAVALGVSGWVRNLADGSVEVVAAGEPDAIAALVEWLWDGPPAASVSGVDVVERGGPVPPGFDVVT
jgi:acylphosphatase